MLISKIKKMIEEVAEGIDSKDVLEAYWSDDQDDDSDFSFGDDDDWDNTSREDSKEPHVIVSIPTWKLSLPADLDIWDPNEAKLAEQYFMDAGAAEAIRLAKDEVRKVFGSLSFVRFSKPFRAEPDHDENEDEVICFWVPLIGKNAEEAAKAFWDDLDSTSGRSADSRDIDILDKFAKYYDHNDSPQVSKIASLEDTYGVAIARVDKDTLLLHEFYDHNFDNWLDDPMEASEEEFAEAFEKMMGEVLVRLRDIGYKYSIRLPQSEIPKDTYMEPDYPMMIVSRDKLDLEEALKRWNKVKVLITYIICNTP